MYKKVCENKGFCDVIIPSADTKILQFNQYQKSDKIAFNNYGDLECKQRRLMDIKIILRINLQQK